ncbi:hypothetical protein BDN70DRAFT_929917 [Pholiota conissans]|uniref:Uncharacterized protein n=1 Tax=Pholiota conissans TaxID=109636 RepID=A0A9P5Z9P2_9AGAR|nr:hypothetical protein BDN70DRAFT_929917 [Pholiota conissans]
MSSIVRDTRFSVSMPLPDEKRGVSSRPRASFGRQFERGVVRVWKFVTRTTRKHPRNSFISPDFIVLTARRRSTTIQPQLYRNEQ